MEKGSAMIGMSGIKEMLANDEKKKKLMIAAITPLALAGLTAGGLLFRKKLKAPANWGTGGRESFIKEIAGKVSKSM